MVYEYIGEVALGDVRADPRKLGFFRLLGLPLSLVVIGTLCFGIIEADRSFTVKQRRAFLYPSLAWFFAGWVILDFGVSVSTTRQFWVLYQFSGMQLPIISRMSLAAPFLVALVGSAVSRFNPTFFRVLFPVCSVCLAIVVVIDASTSRPSARFDVLVNYSFLLFHLIDYFFLNAKFHENRLKRPVLKHLPASGLVLVVAPFVHEYPEVDALRAVFPRVSLFTGAVFVISDVFIISLLTVLTAAGLVLIKSSSLTPRDRLGEE